MTKTINTLLASQSFTELEIKVLIQLNEDVRGNFNERYSNTECKTLAKVLNLEVATIKGVVGSLCKKGALDTYDGRINRGDPSREFIVFNEQEDMEYEPYTTAPAPAPTAEKPTVKAFNFEVYTKNPDTGETGWDIKFPTIFAETKAEAKEFLKTSYPNFDCIILFNYGTEIKDGSNEAKEYATGKKYFDTTHENRYN